MTPLEAATQLVANRLRAELLTVAKRLGRMRAAAHRQWLHRPSPETAQRLTIVSDWSRVVDRLGEMDPLSYGGLMPDLKRVVRELEQGEIVPLRVLNFT